MTLEHQTSCVASRTPMQDKSSGVEKAGKGVSFQVKQWGYLTDALSQMAVALQAQDVSFSLQLGKLRQAYVSEHK